MEKIICIPTKSDKLRISVRITGEMVKDFCDCLRKAYTMSGKDCDTCSWEILPSEMLECVRWMKLEKQ